MEKIDPKSCSVPVNAGIHWLVDEINRVNEVNYRMLDAKAEELIKIVNERIKDHKRRIAKVEGSWAVFNLPLGEKTSPPSPVIGVEGQRTATETAFMTRNGFIHKDQLYPLAEAYKSNHAGEVMSAVNNLLQAAGMGSK